MIKVLDETGIKVGNKKYTQQISTHGLPTLCQKYVDIDQNAMTFRFIGKSNKEREVNMKGEPLNKYVKLFSEQPGYNLFRYKDSEGKWHDVDSDDLNINRRHNKKR